MYSMPQERDRAVCVWFIFSPSSRSSPLLAVSSAVCRSILFWCGAFRAILCLAAAPRDGDCGAGDQWEGNRLQKHAQIQEIHF